MIPGGTQETLSIILDKTKSEPFLKEVADIKNKIAEFDKNMNDALTNRDNQEALKSMGKAHANVLDAEGLLDSSKTMYNTSDSNPIKEDLKKQVKQRREILETTGSVEQT